ncbi:FAD-binding oxidoreductase [Nonomuraea sp. NPDC005650]|uniref:FAD-binding oxidoreductase n=1 Tax=Nonomuraea sp. NPDC005650 TaxID=3157045 RepID=UPI0033A87C81
MSGARSITDKGGIKIMPEDRRFASLSRGFNPRWTSHPQYVRLVRTSEEVVHALQQAVDEPSPADLRTRITVRSGGHCYEDFVCAEDVRVIIDVSLMNNIYEDRGMICVEAGATNGDLRKRLFLLTGKALPGGSCPSVGIGGHVPAGGFGLLSRQFGLTVDYLHAVEIAVVDKDGKVSLETVSRDQKNSDPDRYGLWWANTGGGGGNFGIVTKFWFKGLPDAPERVLFVASGWEWADMRQEHFTQIIENFGEFFASGAAADPEQYGPLFGILLLTHRSKKKVGLIAQIDAGLPNAGQRMDAFRRAMRGDVPIGLADLDEAYGEYAALSGLAEPKPLPWDSAEKLLGPVDNLRCGKHKSAYMLDRMPGEQIEALWRALALEKDGIERDAVVQIDSYGAAINTVPVEDTAVAQRSSILKLQHQIYWPVDKDGTDHLRWIRKLYQDMYAATGGVPASPAPARPSVTDGCYIGYPDVDLNDRPGEEIDRWSTLYYGSHYEALQRVKDRWDPRDIFRHQQSIELPPQRLAR